MRRNRSMREGFAHRLQTAHLSFLWFARSGTAVAYFQEEYCLSDGSGRTRKERHSGTYQTYSPDKLTNQDLLFYSDVVAASSKTEEAVRSLNEKARYLTNAEPLAQLIMRAEAVASSRIEGLEVGARKLLQEKAYLGAINGVRGHRQYPCDDDRHRRSRACRAHHS